VFLYCDRSCPLSSDVWKRTSTRSFTAGHTSFHTTAGSSSLTSTFQDYALNTLRSTSSIVRRGIATGACCGRGSSSLIAAGSRRKKVASSSSACSTLSAVTVLSALFSGGILSNTVVPPGLRYFAACQMFVLSARNSSQWIFFCLWIASWYCQEAAFASISSSGTTRPARYSDLA
jgi:hypothetical protein